MSGALRLLLLGGTSEAAELARRLLDESGVEIESSLAGRVTQPLLPPGPVRIGGFGGVDGMVAYLAERNVGAVIDATHPFAANISRNAASACARLNAPLVALVRPQWESRDGDRWHPVDDMAGAAARAHELGERIFLTIGRQELAPFARYDDRWFLIRLINAPETALPPRHELLFSRGPFTFDDEVQLMLDRSIDVVVSKNSGGGATFAKIEAARSLGIPVVMVRRPARPAVPAVRDVEDVMKWVAQRKATVRA